MKKILFTLLALSYMLIANGLPNTITTTIANLNTNGEIQLSNSVPVGMSGIVIHNYGNGLSAISHAVVSQGGSHASLHPYQAILHENIPNIQTEAKVGDKVIFGNFYHNALVIAPNQRAYQAVTQQYQRTWVHPDAYALDFMKEGSKRLNVESLKKFAQLNQVGLVLIVEEKSIRILDPISQQFIGNIATSLPQGEPITPFYARFEEVGSSLFNFASKSYLPYFQSVAGLQ